MQSLNGLIFKPTQEEASARLRDADMDCLVLGHSHGRLERGWLCLLYFASSYDTPVASLSGFSQQHMTHLLWTGTVLLSPSLFLAASLWGIVSSLWKGRIKRRYRINHISSLSF